MGNNGSVDTLHWKFTPKTEATYELTRRWKNSNPCDGVNGCCSDIERVNAGHFNHRHYLNWIVVREARRAKSVYKKEIETFGQFSCIESISNNVRGNFPFPLIVYTRHLWKAFHSRICPLEATEQASVFVCERERKWGSRRQRGKREKLPRRVRMRKHTGKITSTWLA